MDNHTALLNAPISEIMDKLLFYTTDSPETAERALYSKPALGGYSIIEPNDGSGETEVDLEMLFEFALDRPDRMALIFK